MFHKRSYISSVDDVLDVLNMDRSASPGRTPANRPIRKRPKVEAHQQSDRCVPSAAGSGPSGQFTHDRLPLGKRIRPESSTAASIASSYRDVSGTTVSPAEGGFPSEPARGGLIPQAATIKQSKAVSREARRKQNHSMIERRRREKMNKAFADLRAMVPGLMEDGGIQKGEFKLEVLERTVEHMRDLKGLLASDTERGGVDGRNLLRMACGRCFHATTPDSPDGEREGTKTDESEKMACSSALDEGSSQTGDTSDNDGTARLGAQAEHQRSRPALSQLKAQHLPLWDQLTNRPGYILRTHAAQSGAAVTIRQAPSASIPSSETLLRANPRSNSMSRSDSQATIPEDQLPAHGSVRPSLLPRSPPTFSRHGQAAGEGLSPGKPSNSAGLATVTNGKRHLPEVNTDHWQASLRDPLNQSLYLPPPVPTHPSPVSPFFTIDPTKRFSVEPSPMLPPLPGMHSLFGDIPITTLDWRGPSAERQNFPAESAPEPSAISAVNAGTAAVSDGTESSLGKEEQDAANVLLAFSSPEAMTPFTHASAAGLSLERWSLDHGARLDGMSSRGESHTKPARLETKTGVRTAKTARDMLTGMW